MGTSPLPRLRELLGLSNKGGIWRLLAITFALLNLKSLPLVWHFRLLKAFLRHLVFSPTRLSPKDGPSVLFQPLIVTSRSPLFECDYNLHKSNSTYFTDLDASRTALVACLCKEGIDKLQKSSKDRVGRFGIMLGAVSCSFKKEIKPYEAYEVWSRILSWDRKWMYIVSHFVKKGSVKPKAYLLQPWRKVLGGKGSYGSKTDDPSGLTIPNPAIFASAISKYVFKKGRLTIPPERILQDSGLLPAQPEEDYAPSMNTATPVESTSVEVITATAIRAFARESAHETIERNLEHLDGVWDWTRIEEERLRGLKIAATFAKLDTLSEEFTGEERPALGSYTDI